MLKENFIIHNSKGGIIIFSVIICTYNGGKKLKHVLDCILKQNKFDELVDELIIVDNNSTDETHDIVVEYEQTHERVRGLYESKPGLTNARACGVKSCESEWIVFLDDDNYIEQGWIEGVNDYISVNPNMGAFNGNVIPIFERNLSEDEQTLLDIVYLGLACTSSLKTNILLPDSKKWLPFGAGLVIRAAPLKNLLNKGWLNSEGRKQDLVISGEDTEMVLHIISSGLDTGFCKEVTMFHDIGLKRLNMEYLQKLYYSFGVAHYNSISVKKYGNLRVIKYSIISKFNICKMRMTRNNASISKHDYYYNVLEEYRIRGFFDSVKKKWL